MSYLIYGVQIWKITNTKLASCVKQGKWEKEKKSFDKNHKINPFYLTMRTRIQPLLFNRS